MNVDSVSWYSGGRSGKHRQHLPKQIPTGLNRGTTEVVQETPPLVNRGQQVSDRGQQGEKSTLTGGEKRYNRGKTGVKQYDF